MHSIFIADDDRRLVDRLEKLLGTDVHFKVVAKAYDGSSAIDHIVRLRPDVLVLGIVMPEADGIYIVNYMRALCHSYAPVIYMISSMRSGKMMKRLESLDVDYFSLKPVSPCVIMQNLISILEKQESAQVSAQASLEAQRVENKSIAVRDVVLRMGALPHLLSTKCLTATLLFCLENKSTDHLLCKAVYLTVAKQLSVNTCSVEKNIRNAIAAIQNAQSPLFQEIFAYTGRKRITNREFLSVVSEYVDKNG